MIAIIAVLAFASMANAGGLLSNSYAISEVGPASSFQLVQKSAPVAIAAPAIGAYGAGLAAPLAYGGIGGYGLAGNGLGLGWAGPAIAAPAIGAYGAGLAAPLAYGGIGGYGLAGKGLGLGLGLAGPAIAAPAIASYAAPIAAPLAYGKGIGLAAPLAAPIAAPLAINHGIATSYAAPIAAPLAIGGYAKGLSIGGLGYGLKGY